MRVEESIFSDRPPEAMFGFLSVRSNDPVRTAAVTESEWLDPDAPMAVGRRGGWLCRRWAGASSSTR